jgi:Cys-tRNA synthase (O-phospho-L-seryl-tRNA:Cys-tRNA synthase)
MRREDCIIHCAGPDCEGCLTYKSDSFSTEEIAKKDVKFLYKELSYRRVQNLGNYSTETLELTVTVENDQDIDDIFKEIKAKVRYLLDKK